ncbi:hypothetical protein AMTR_s00015p00229890 [Amborella trichopoda]|uniref:Uncharacterized protein n=1 Tax=Amborella trichopoda TaxID=13333 RepID=W1PFY5_AMBTC|nr:hypothetical protein AMTR_s00015p00229890 [Amborella trichopoda]
MAEWKRSQKGRTAVKKKTLTSGIRGSSTDGRKGITRGTKGHGGKSFSGSGVRSGAGYRGRRRGITYCCSLIQIVSCGSPANHRDGDNRAGSSTYS